jgi:hypothetical protein
LAIDENDNGAMRDAYNKLDMLAAKLNAALIAVHHASKGNQAGKSITDVGAGAGSQSRAADCHLVLREHETPGILVMDAVTRSFPAPAPVCIRREFPVFHVDATADPTALKSDRPSRKSKEKTEETAPPPAPPKPQRASIEDLLECASETPQQEAAIQAVAEKRGMTTKRFKELFKQATATERLHLWKIETADGRFKLYAKIPQENTQSAQST